MHQSDKRKKPEKKEEADEDVDGTETQREREHRRKPLLPCDKHLIFRKSSKSCPEWVHRQTDRQTVKGGDRRLTTNQGKPWSRPTKTRVSRSLWQRKWHTHTHWERHTYTHIHTQLQLYTREASKQFRGILQGAETLVKKSKPPQIGHGNSSATDVNVRTNTHTHTLWETHARTHMWV